MKAVLAAGALAGLLLAGGWSWGGPPAAPPAVAQPTAPTALSWSIWPAAADAAPRRSADVGDAPGPAAPEIDVVDAHWMALTMWGEARGQGEEAMRAVGHVIDNRRRAGMHGAYVTDTVGEAFQFSCWNAGDPNRAAIEAVDRLAEGSREHRMWRAAKRLADEIMAGRSVDPTGGALFYHSLDVAPRWSEGVPAVAQIGGHLFFRRARS